jgi:methionine-rich copper-binding protein CopC
LALKRSLIMRIFPALALAGLIGAFAGAALAHSKIVSSTPADKAAVAAPSVITATFNETFTPALSGLELKDAAGKAVKTNVVRPNPPNAKQLAISPAAPLAKGAYRVDWHIVGGDGHRVTGAFTFTVR